MKLNYGSNDRQVSTVVPLNDADVVNKKYVDDQVVLHSSNTSLHLTTAQNSWIDAITASAAQVNFLVGVTSGVQGQIDTKFAKAGGTLTGFLTLHDNPSSNYHAATKLYVDSGLDTKVNKTGDTLTGYLIAHSAPSQDMHLSNKKYVDDTLSTHATNNGLHVTPTQKTLLNEVTATSTQINYLVGTTGAIQTQLNGKLNLTGGTLTGLLTLASAPTVDLHAATKKYVDDVAATRLSLAGGTMTGALNLAGAPVSDNQASNKKYVDDSLSLHVNDNNKHLTVAQNTWIDGITATATQVNQLTGISSNVQDQLDSKLDLTGGVLTGDLQITEGNTLTVGRSPSENWEVATKGYVDDRFSGRAWINPVSCSCLVGVGINNPDPTPFDGMSFIVGSVPTGDWVGRAGRLVTWVDGFGWKTVQTSPVAVGARFGVGFLPASAGYNITGALAGQRGFTVEVTDITSGVYTFEADARMSGTSVLIYDEDAPDFGFTYTYSDEGTWVVTNKSTNITAGDGLTMSGRAMTVKAYKGLETHVSNGLSVSLETASGMNFSVSNKLQLQLDGTTLSKSANGVKLSDTLNTIVINAVRKDTANTVTGEINVTAAGKLTYAGSVTNLTDVTTKGYVDGIQSTLNSAINSLTTTVNALNTDPVTRNYVNTELATKLNLAGGTMTGALTLSGAPSNNLHAATKAYVDGLTTTHATDNTIHVTPTQKTLLNAITVSAAEINYLAGTTSSVQTQLTSKLALAGGTMTGALVLNGAPTLDLHASTKKYVDDSIATRLPMAGGTLTGPLTLSAAPTVDLHASTKKYVDDSVIAHSGNAALHLTAGQNTWIDAITTSAAEVNYLIGTTSGIQAQINSRLSMAGGSMTGFITLHAAPTNVMHAATKQYVDNADSTKLNLSGGTMTGTLKLYGTPDSANDAVPLSFLLDQIATANTYTDTEAAKKVSKAGDVMTGFLTLHANPSTNMQAAPKQYVDTAVSTLSSNVNSSITTLQGRATALETTVGALNTDPVTKQYVDSGLSGKMDKAGATMSGALTLSGDPVNALHAATKQYVDNVASGLNPKMAVRLATTVNLAATYNNGSAGVNATLTGSTNGVLVVDTKTPLVGDRILVKNQTAALQNGDYTVVQPGSAGTPFILKRAVGIDQSNEVPGSYLTVFDGAANKGTSWVFTVADPVTYTIGTDAITINQWSGPGSMIDGNGINLTGNVISVKTASAARIVTSGAGVDLATTGVTANTYKSVTVDVYGRVTGGTNPTTLSGYGITDAQAKHTKLDTISALSTRGILVLDNTDTPKTRAIGVSGTGLSINDDSTGAAGTPITITSNATNANTPSTVVARDASGNFTAGTITAALAGNAATATILQTTRAFNIAGDVTATAQNFNGSANVTLTAVLAASGVTAGTYRSVTVDAKGRVTAATNPTTLAGYAITDAQPLATHLTNISALATRGLMVIDSTDSPKIRKFAVSGTGLSISDDGSGAASGALTITSNATSANTPSTVVARDASGNFTAGTVTAALAGNATTATTLQTTRTFTITGDVTATAQNFNGGANVSLATTLVNSGVTAGTYKSVTVDAKGRVTAGSNPTTLAGYGITDAVTTAALTAEIDALKAQIAELHAYILNRI